MKKLQKKFSKITTFLKNKFYKNPTSLSNKKVFYLVCIVIFVMMFILNYFTPMLADDYSYSFGMNGRLGSIKNIFEFQIHHYLTWGGRSVVHTIAQLFLLVGKNWFNIFNTIVYLIFILSIYKLIVGKEKKYRYDILILINMLIWFFLPVFGQNILWLVGACNYLWGTTLVLLFLLPYRLKLDVKCHNSIILAILMLIFGIIAGWTNENNAAALLVILVLFGVYRLYNKKNITIWHIGGFVGALVGFLFMILAPGNSIRSEKFANNNGLLWNLFHRFLDITNNFSKYLLPLLILVIIISIMGYYFGTHKKNKLYITFIFIISSMVATYSMILSPTFPDRSWMGPVTLMIAAMANAYSNLDFNKDFTKTLTYVIITICIAFFIITYYSGLRNIQNLNNSWNDRINYIEKEKDKSNKDITVQRIYTYNKYVAMYGLTDVYEESQTWLNIAVSKYYEINSIKSID